MIDEADLAPLREVSHVDYREESTIAEEELADACADYDFLMLNYDVVKSLSSKFYQRPEVRRLRAISTDITGMDWASPQAALDNGVVLLNIPHYSTDSVAETTVAEVLLHSRQRHLAYLDSIKGREIQERKGINLSGRRAGIVGLGSIGTRVAELLTGFGMEIVAWNRSPKAIFNTVPLAEVFETAQVICICLKTVREGADANVGIIDAALLSRCRDAIIVNLANPDLVDNDSIANEIGSGRIMAYSVEYSERLASGPLGSLDQVHMPPHNSWLSDESMQMLRHTWVRNIILAVGDEYPNSVRS